MVLLSIAPRAITHANDLAVGRWQVIAQAVTHDDIQPAPSAAIQELEAAEA